MKRFIVGMLIVGGLMVGASPKAVAEKVKSATVVLATPIVEGDPAGFAACQVVDVSADDVTVLVEQVNGFGTVVSSYSCPLPAYTNGPGCIVQNPSTTPYYCRFTFSGDKQQVRASMNLTLAGSLPTVVVAQ